MMRQRVVRPGPKHPNRDDESCNVAVHRWDKVGAGLAARFRHVMSRLSKRRPTCGAAAAGRMANVVSVQGIPTSARDLKRPETAGRQEVRTTPFFKPKAHTALNTLPKELTHDDAID